MLTRVKNYVYRNLPKQLFYGSGAQPNIAIYAARRGGSSILSQLIATQSGIREIDQPFDLFQPDSLDKGTRKKYLPDMPDTQFFDLSPEQESQVFDYLTEIFAGGHRYLFEPRWQRDHRVLLKIVNAPFLLDRFDEEFDLVNIYLSRHPIPQAISVIRNGWVFTYAAYLENEAFILKYLSEKQLNLARQIDKSGSDLEKGIINWIFENLYPLKFAKSVDLRLTYYDLVVNREQSVASLAESLQLPDLNPQVLDKPSRSHAMSDKSTLQAIKSGERTFLTDKWLQEVDKADKQKVQYILNIFEIGEYSAFESQPQQEAKRSS